VYTQINLDMSYMFYDASSFNITLCWDLSQIYSDNIFFGAGSNADAIDCTGQPTGQPTTQPTGQPTTQPPTGQPTTTPVNSDSSDMSDDEIAILVVNIVLVFSVLVIVIRKYIIVQEQEPVSYVGVEMSKV